MATKFSDFTAQAATGTTFVVGYDGTTNTRYTQDQLTNFVLNGDLTANANVGLATYNLGFTNGKVGVGLASPLYTFETRATVANNWVARIMNESSTGHGLILKVDSNSSGKVTFATQNSIGYTMTVHNNGNVAIGKNNLTGPSARLHVKGAGTTSATTAFLVERSNGNDIFRISDDRSIALLGASTFYNGATIDNAGVSDASAILTVNSTTKGLLPPRMTNTQRDAIGSPATGLTLYSTTDNKLQFYNGSAWQDAAGGDNIYTADGTINEDRTITVGYPTSDPKNTYVTTFESNKTVGTSNSQKNISGTQIAIKETVNLLPSSYYQTRGAVLKLQHTKTGGSVNTEGYVQAFSINSGSSDYTNRDQMGFRTNKAFVLKATDYSWPLYFAVQGGPSNNYHTLKYSNGSNGGLFQLSAGNARTTRFTISDAGTHYRYIEALNTGKFELGRKTGSSASDEAFITMNGIGSWNGDIGVGINQGTPTATLHVTGSGATSSTTSFLVENSNGDDILNIKDDGAFALGRGATPSISQSVVIGDTATANQRGISIGYSTTSGDSGVTIGWDAGVSFATGRNINIGYTARASGLSSILLTAANGNGPVNNTENYNFSVYMTSQSTPDFRVIGNEGMIPPSITTTVRDAISSPVSGSTIYNTTDNKLQFYNGSSWTDAEGGGDSIYTADGTLSGNRTVTVPNGGALNFAASSGSFTYSIGSVYITSTGLVRLPTNSGSFTINSYNTTLRQNYLQLYGGAGAKLNGTVNGFLTVSNTTGTSFSINARLGVIGKSTTSTTDYAFRVQQSDNTDLFTLRDDGAITIGRGATLFDEDGNGVQDVVIGYGASTDYASTYFSNQRRVAIGYNADVNAGGGIAIGHSATIGNTEGVAIGYSAQTTAYRATAVGYDASAGSYGIAVGAYSSTTGPNSVAIGGTQNATTGYGVHVGIGGSAGISSVSVGANSVSGTNATSIGKSASSTGVGAFTAGASMVNSGAYSFAFGGFAYGAAGATNTDSNSVKFYMNTTTPQLNFHLNNDSWWNSTGNFGFGITNPTDRIQVPTSIGIIGDSTNAGKLKLYCEAGTAHHVAIEGPAHSGGSTYTIKLPASAPSAGQVLVSDANGNLSWKSPHQLDFSNLPTSDPGVEGRLYNDEGTLKVSIP